jgi:hypothetical protein
MSWIHFMSPLASVALFALHWSTQVYRIVGGVTCSAKRDNAQ